MTKKEKVCENCGKLFTYKNRRARFCTDCRVRKNRERSREYRIKMKPQRRSDRADAFCMLCAHKIEMSVPPIGERMWACGYILDTGRMRGCPPGAECDKFVPEGDETVKKARERMRMGGFFE